MTKGGIRLTVNRPTVWWIIGTTLLLEGSWILAALGVAGIGMGVGGSLISWTGLITIMGISSATIQLASSSTRWKWLTYHGHALLGVATIYFVVSIQIAQSLIPEIKWIILTFSKSADKDYGIEAAVAGIIGLLVWWRAKELVVAKSPTRNLAFSFRIGIPILAMATIVDIAQPVNLHTVFLIFIFFASGLAGLTIGQLVLEKNQSYKFHRWSKTIFGLVSGILLTGLAASLLQQDFLSSVTEALKSLLAGLLWGILIPIFYVIDLFMNALLSFFDRPFEVESSQSQEQIGETINRFASSMSEIPREEEQIVENSINFFKVTEWVLLAVGVLLVLCLIFYLLVKVVRHSRTYQAGQEQEVRESTRKDGVIISDFANLLRNIIPGWLNMGERHTNYNLPNEQKGIVEALRIYYTLLVTAEKKGFHRSSYETATEFQSTLEKVFPQDLVNASTTAFNRAFYGHIPATEKEISNMRYSLKNLSS